MWDWQLLQPANNNKPQHAEKASELQDVKNVDETDHMHSPSYNKENLAEQTPIINEQVSLDSVVNDPTQQASNTLQIVESESVSDASNTTTTHEDTKPKLIQPTVIRNDQPVQTKTGSGSNQPPPNQAKTAKSQKKADLDASGNTFIF